MECPNPVILSEGAGSGVSRRICGLGCSTRKMNFDSHKEAHTARRDLTGIPYIESLRGNLISRHLRKTLLQTPENHPIDLPSAPIDPSSISAQRPVAPVWHTVILIAGIVLLSVAGAAELSGA